MPTYCFTTPEGKTVDRYFSVSERPDEIVLDDGTVAKRDLAAEWSDIKCSGDYRPLECYASGVHPSQAQELRDFYKKHGESVDVTNNGNPVYTSYRQRKRLLKLRGMCDKNDFS